jgi:hypothetical protein
MKSVVTKIDDALQLDITKPETGVEILIRGDAKVIWVNVDGICVLRICQIPFLEVKDDRKDSL